MYSIIVPTHNRSKILSEMLDSFFTLYGLDTIDFELIIIVNACRDDTYEVAQNQLSQQSFKWKVYVEKTPGLSHARNCGLKHSGGEVIVYLDDDVKFDENWLIGLDKSFKKSKFDIIGGKIDLWWRNCHEPNWFTEYERRLLGFNDHGERIIAADTSMVFGGNFAVNREVFGSVGNFDSNYGRVGNKKGAGEEANFVKRAVTNGYSVGYSPHFRVNHLVSPERITLKALRRFSVGAGRARGLVRESGFVDWLLRLIKLPIQCFKKYKSHNIKHAYLFLFNRLAELKIIR